MQLFYNEEIKKDDLQFTFDKEESRHIVKVLRKSAGDILHITNGNGWVFEVEIILADVKNCTVKILNSEQGRSRNYYLHLVVAPTKMNDRYEWFLEKATEIGVDEITPIICEHSERKVIKTDRFQKIMQSAMKQSLQYYLPKLNEAIDFNTFLNQEFDGQLFIAHCEDTERASLKRKALADHKITILIGPEGDFSTDEIHAATKKGFIPVTMGENRLRTETAAVVAASIIAFVND